MSKPEIHAYNELVSRIGLIMEHGREAAFHAVNYHLVITYWEIGRYIVEFEQRGEIRAEYGKELMIRLSKDLTLRFGKGMSRSNLTYMRQFFLEYEKIQLSSGKFIIHPRDEKSETVSHISSVKGETVSDVLNWSHYFELLKIQSPMERSFYEKQCLQEKWSIRELKRQVRSGLFLRLALSKDKSGVLELSKHGHAVRFPGDVVKDPYVFEFLNLPEKELYRESDLEQALIDRLQHFLLELGKGFAFIGRQYRITLGNTHYRVDLVFYHRILKCFVLIELKLGEATHQDIGQMNLYLNYFEREESVEGDGKPVGIVLAASKDNILVEYATGNLNAQLFVSTYKLYLPDAEELRAQLTKILKT